MHSKYKEKTIQFVTLESLIWSAIIMRFMKETEQLTQK